jgi:hypothetical protein
VHQFYKICTRCTRTELTVILTKLPSASLIICYTDWTASTVPSVSLLMCYIHWTPCTLSPVTLLMCYTYWTPDTVYFVSLLICFMNWTPDMFPTVSLVTCVTLDEDILLPLSFLWFVILTEYLTVICVFLVMSYTWWTPYTVSSVSPVICCTLYTVSFLLQDVSHHGNPELYIQNTKVCAWTWVNINFKKNKAVIYSVIIQNRALPIDAFSQFYMTV